MTKRSLCALLLCLSLPAAAQGDGFRELDYLDTAPEIPTDPRGPLATSAVHVASWLGGYVTVRGKRLQQTSQIEFTECPTAMTFTPSGEVLLIGSADGGVHCYKRGGGAPKWKGAFKGGAVGCLRVSPDNRFVAVAGSFKATLFRVIDGESLGSIKIKTSGLQDPDGKRLPLLVWHDASLLAVVESKSVRFVRVDPAEGITKAAQGEVVKLQGTALSAARLGRLDGLCVGSTKGILQVRRGKKPKVLVKAKESGSPVALVAGRRFVAGLTQDRRHIVIFDLKGQSLVRRSRQRLVGRFGDQIACPPDGEIVFFISHPEDDATAGDLDGLDVTAGILRRGALPQGAVALRFEDDGALACVVSPPRRTDSAKPRVELWKWAKGGSLERAHAHTAELVEVGSELCLIRGADGLKVLDRTTGGLSPLSLPEALSGKDMSLQHRYLIVGGDEAFEVFDTRTGGRLGAWKAMSRRTLAVSPNGAFVARLVHELATPELICERVGKGEAWRRPLNSANTELLISPGGARLIVSGVEVRDLASGEQLYELSGTARFSRDGKRVLVDQWDRNHSRALVLEAETGAVETTLLWMQSKSRVQSGFQLLAIDRAGLRLVARSHKPPRRGLWLYGRD